MCRRIEEVEPTAELQTPLTFRLLRKTAPLSRLLRHAGDTENKFSTCPPTPPPPRVLTGAGGTSTEGLLFLHLNQLWMKTLELLYQFQSADAPYIN